MDRVLVCECGFEARAADEEDLAAQIRRHALEAHGMTLSPQEALLLASQADSTPRASIRRQGEEER